MNRNKIKINDIKSAINKIEESLSHKKFYEFDDIEKYGILFLLQIIGEAARYLTEDFKENNKQIPWKEIIGFRNFVVHQYMDVKWEVIEKILYSDLPELETKIEKIKL
ncbi:unnamed protein product [marine sediment metagenome]|uniref:DUF86 domain-containing protein n=1 Tax=marine sediment metagenome TaxID=412755 RepID=X0SQ98_9ZZZZ